jgi:hypothetical protein
MIDSQILEHSSTPVNYTLFDVNWVPSSPRLVVCGSTLAGEGTLRMYTLELDSWVATILLACKVKNLSRVCQRLDLQQDLRPSGVELSEVLLLRRHFSVLGFWGQCCCSGLGGAG